MESIQMYKTKQIKTTRTRTKIKLREKIKIQNRFTSISDNIVVEFGGF